jgi:hypothetical protein
LAGHAERLCVAPLNLGVPGLLGTMLGQTETIKIHELSQSRFISRPAQVLSAKGVAQIGTYWRVQGERGIVYALKLTLLISHQRKLIDTPSERGHLVLEGLAWQGASRHLNLHSLRDPVAFHSVWHARVDFGLLMALSLVLVGQDTGVGA